MKYLKDIGNPHYQFYEEKEEFEKRCFNNDPYGFETMFGEVDDATAPMSNNVRFVHDDDVDTMMDLQEFKGLQEVSEEEKVDKENDPTRKFQIDYDKSVCLTQQFPQAFHQETEKREEIMNDGIIVFAPGEGKIPENILTSENWDALAFPLKHPDGNFNLHHKRSIRLSDQYYFVQRIRNKDPRFRLDPAYLFAATGFIEKKQLQNNINVSFLRGKKEVSQNGNNMYKLKDGFSVFDNIVNTPTYWKKAKMEMIAKLDNFGPFQFFFTLSCADILWEENFAAFLREQGRKIVYEIEGSADTTFVEDDEGNKVELQDYIKDYMDESLHELMRRNVVTATRIYNHRFKSFIREIITDSSNPMCIEHYSAKLEFQGRGAAHNHGTLWCNMKNVEMLVDCENENRKEIANNNEIEEEIFCECSAENENEFKFEHNLKKVNVTMT